MRGAAVDRIQAELLQAGPIDRLRPEDDIGVDVGRLVAGVEHHGIHLAAILGDRQGARVAAEQIELRRRGLQMKEVEDLDGVLLRHGHEGVAADEHDIGRLVADRQCPDRRPQVQVDDADRVGQMIDDPGFRVAAGDDAHRLEPDRYRGQRRQAAVREDGEHLQKRVRGVDHQEPAPRRRQGHRVDLRGLEVDVLGPDRAAHGQADQKDPGRQPLQPHAQSPAAD